MQARRLALYELHNIAGTQAREHDRSGAETVAEGSNAPNRAWTFRNMRAWAVPAQAVENPLANRAWCGDCRRNVEFAKVRGTYCKDFRVCFRHGFREH